MLRCGSPNVAGPLLSLVLFDLRRTQRTVGECKSNVTMFFSQVIEPLWCPQRRTYSCSCRRVDEVGPIACSPQGEAHFLRTTYKLQQHNTHNISRCFMTYSRACINNKWKAQGWPSGAAGLCHVLLLHHTDCSGVWPSLLWWDWWELRGTAARDLTHKKKKKSTHTLSDHYITSVDDFVKKK